MCPTGGYSEAEIREMDKKDFRKEFPSGWMEVARYETLALIIDALLESPSSREYTVDELADKAGPSARSIEDRIGSLVELGIVDELEGDRDEPRYCINDRSPITQKLYDLNITVNRVKEGDLPLSMSTEPAEEISNTGDGGSGKSRFNHPDDDLSSEESTDSGYSTTMRTV